MVKMRKDFRELVRTIHSEDWADTETVTIRRFYGDADRRRVMSAASEYRQDDEGRTVIVGTLDRLHTTKRTLAIKSWTLLDEEGQPLPLTSDIVANLPSEVAAFIDAAIDEEWSGLGTTVANAAEAQTAKAEAKEEAQTFQRSSVRDVGGQEGRMDGALAQGAGPGRRSRTAAP